MEADVGDFDDDPADEPGDGRDVDEPAEDDRGVVANVEVHERQQCAGQRDGVVGRAEAVATLEDGGGVPVAAQAV